MSTTPDLPAASSLDAAFAHIDEMVARVMARDVTPGISLAITDRDTLLSARTYGFANLDAQIPVMPETLFEIGSIGKSFTAVVFLQLAAEGIVDLHAPVQTYLPWFAVQSEYGPITLHHLLTHTAGIIGGSDHVPDPRYELWTLRRTRTYAAPGEQYSYSNLGYKALGIILEELLHKPYAEIIRERIFAPLGMTDAWAEITHEMRPLLAVGYADQFDDRPRQPWHRHVPATWLESNTGDGCISTHAIDLARYVRTLLNHGSGPDGTILTAEQFATMRNPHTGPSPRPTYGYALDRPSEEETHRFGHSGGMVGYVSQMIGDLDAGLGAIALCNGRGPVSEIASFALATITAARQGDELPRLPDVVDPLHVPNVGDYVGTYVGDTGTLEIVATDAHRLAIEVAGEPVPLRLLMPQRSPDVFVADHPAFALAPLRFDRADAADAASPVVEVTYGDRWYRHDRHDGPTTFTYPEAWDAFVGHYRSHDPWYTNLRIGIIKGKLVLLSYGHAETLVPESDGFRVGTEPDSPDWITFDAIVNGQALVLRYEDGAEYARFFTP